jgi:hypothetical protein
MATLYTGIPGPPNVVVVIDETGSHALNGAPFGWGKKCPASHVVNLARALLRDAMPERPGAAAQLAMRYAWRGPMLWAAEKAWRTTSEEILEIVRAIEQVDAETARMRAQVAREPAPRVSEAGIGVSGSFIKWGK